jgi:hypothetical protein
MRFTAAFFVPGLGALFNQFDLFIAICFRNGTPYRDFVLSKESIMVNLYSINSAMVTKEDARVHFVADEKVGLREALDHGVIEIGLILGFG